MRKSRQWILLLSGTAIVSVLCVYLCASENRPIADKSADLSQRVAALEAKVAQLEKKLEEQAVRGPYLPQPAPMVPYRVPPNAPPAPGEPAPQISPAVPPTGVPYQFNGQTYYIMPLGKNGTN